MDARGAGAKSSPSKDGIKTWDQIVKKVENELVFSTGNASYIKLSGFYLFLRFTGLFPGLLLAQIFLEVEKRFCFIGLKTLNFRLKTLDFRPVTCNYVSLKQLDRIRGQVK